LIERRTESIDEGFERLRRALEDLEGKSVEATADAILSAMLPESGADDDVALLCVRLLADRDRSWRHRFPARASELAIARSMVRTWLDREDVGTRHVEEVVLAANEACANAVEHAYVDAGREPRGVDLEVQLVGSDLTVWVTDNGTWRDGAPMLDRGRGFVIMRALMDDVAVERRAAGTTVTLRRRLDGSGATA
jgi:anti-sigma regulatory factor (Ser/Thr protein kinase)